MAGTVVKGALKIETDIDEVEARAVFSPDRSGREWDVASALKLLGELHVTPLPSQRTLEDLLLKWTKAEGTVTAVVARGIPPQPPTGERVSWLDHPVPGDLAELVKDTLARAAPPELYRIRTEKRKLETVVAKPNPLPFLPPKKEIVVTWEKQEIREPVIFDPTVQETAYVDRGMKLGTTFPPKPGKPGKSVFGKPLNAAMAGDGLFLLGEGLERERNELKAGVSGILRIGSNWADIVPLARPAWKVEPAAEGATIALTYEPGDRRIQPPLATDILAAAAALGAAEDDLITADEVKDALDRAARTAEPLYAFPLSRKKEAVARVDISNDGLRATLYLRKGVAGAAPLELRAVSEVIKNSRVRGFKADKLKADILAFFNGADVELSDYLLVEGTAPKRGKDREIQVSVMFLAEEYRRELVARLMSNMKADIPSDPANFFPADEATHAAYVDKGARIAVVTQPPAGADGVDVFGTHLPGLPGNDPDIRLMDGVHMSRNEIVADIGGVLLVKQEGDSFAGRIVPYKDAKIEVRIQADGMKAYLDLERETGAGKPLTAEAVSAAIAEAGIVRGLDGAAVADAILKALEEGKCADAAIAAGEAPVEGGGAAVTWLVKLADGKGVSIREDGHADFKNQNRFTAVNEGTPIAEVVRQGEAGRAGFDVTGKLLEPGKGASVTITHDDSVREEPTEKGVRFVAAKTGELTFDGTTVSVNPLHVVNGDVGPGTGNVNFPGEVRIAGSVAAGFAVIGAGNVTVAGAAEAALVSSGGKAVIAQGVVGAGKGVVRARLGIDALFVEQATLLAVEDVRVKSGCLQCQIKTNGKLRLTGEKGHLIGGFCRARSGVEAANIGSERGTRTEISFGQDYLVKDQIEVAERETDKLKKTLMDLNAKLQQLEGSGANLDAARAEKVRLMKHLEKQGIRLFTLREKFEEHHHSEIRVRGTVFPGVVMESHGRYYEIKQKRSQVVFVFDREIGRIQEKPLK